MGGLLLAASGPTLCFAIAAVAGLGVVAACRMIVLPPYPTRSTGPWLPALREGLAYAAGETDVRRLLLLTAAMGVLTFPYQQLLPAVARDMLQQGPEGLGLLMASVGVGAIVGAVLSGTPPVQRNARQMLFALPIVLALAVVGLGLSRSMFGATVALALIGLSSIGYMSIASATLQLTTREELIGRVMGLWTVVQAGVMPLGSLLLGALADAAGLPTALVLAGLLAAALAVALRGTRPAAMPRAVASGQSSAT
jgi:predicted MFS family arabinose efflux permease